MCIETLAKLSGILRDVSTATAFLVGGIWAYYKFIKGRVFKPKIEIDIKCTSYNQKAGIFIINSELFVKNLGLSRVEFDKEVSAIRIYKIINDDVLQADSQRIKEIEWERISTFDILSEHEWIEPNETIKDIKTFEFNQEVASIYKIEVFLFDKAQKVQWFTDETIQLGGYEMNDYRNQSTRNEDLAEKLRREKEEERKKAEKEKEDAKKK